MKVRTTSTRLAVDAPRRAGYAAILAALLAPLPQAMAQQYPPPAYSVPGQAPPYAGPGYGGPTSAPPALQQEAVPPPPPGPAMVWTPGYWSWAGRWVWVPGRYLARPYRHAVWVPGHWRPRGPTWVWIPGHWRR